MAVFLASNLHSSCTGKNHLKLLKEIKNMANHQYIYVMKDLK